MVSRLLSFKDNAFYLKTTSPEPILLGKNLDEVMAKSKYIWPDIVFVESSWAHGLVIDEQNTISRMNKLYEDIESGNNSGLLSLIDKTAVSECLKQSELLLPRLRRYRKKNLLETTL